MKNPRISQHNELFSLYKTAMRQHEDIDLTNKQSTYIHDY